MGPDAAMLTQIIKEAIEAHNVIGTDPTMEVNPDYDEVDPMDQTVCKDGLWVTVGGRCYHIQVSETSDSLNTRIKQWESEG